MATSLRPRRFLSVPIAVPLAVPLTVLALPALAGLTTLALTTTAGPAGAAPTTCQEQPVTITGTTGGTVTGTPAADVIVSNGAKTVYSLGGDDLVCLTPGAGGYVPDNTDVWDDDSADSVVVQYRAYKRVHAYLGAGSDTFIGGPGRDVVGYEDDDDATYRLPGDVDTVLTGGGNDTVDLQPTYQLPDHSYADVVRLGRGDDQLLLPHNGHRSGGELTGGAGRDSVMAFLGGTFTKVVMRVASGLRIDGADWSLWNGFESAGAYGGALIADTITFVGTDGDDALGPFGFASQKFTVSGGKGDDVIDLTNVGAASPLTVLGGPGRDRLVVSTFRTGSTATVDLGRKQASWRNGDSSFPTDSATLGGLEDADVFAHTTTLSGTDGPNRLRVGCSADQVAHVYGRVGADVLSTLGTCHPRTPAERKGRHLSLHGGRGNDTMVGSPWNDLLHGGKGRDTANGKGGYDRCRAEVRRNCEAR